MKSRASSVLVSAGLFLAMRVIATAGIVMDEVRTRGPNGANDESIEFYNNSDSAVDLSGWEIKGSNNAGVVTDCGDSGGVNQLRQKISDVQNSGGGTITFTCGPTITLASGALPAITGAITIDGAGALTISGNGVTRVFVISSGGALTLKNLTITKGYSSTENGGAIANVGTLTIDNCKFLDNQTDAGHKGGAIHSFGELIVTTSEFGNNKAGAGGAIVPQNSQAKITNSSFHDNAALDTTGAGNGGAVFLGDPSEAIIDNSTFTNNTAPLGSATETAGAGGAIYASANGPLTVKNNSVFRSNSAGNGGAIFHLDNATVTDVTLTGNIANQRGGAISLGVTGTGVLTLSKSTLVDNTAVIQGGGIYNRAGKITVSNATFSRNSARAGGGIYQASGSLPGLNIVNATFVENIGTQAGSGGAIDVLSDPGQTFYMYNVAMAKGTSGINCGSGAASFGYAGSFSDDGSCNFGAGRVNVSLLLGPLANNGGATETHLPQPGSPVIDRGISNGAPVVDQRGVPRPQNFEWDAGAVEVQPSDRVTPTPTPTPEPTPTPTPTPATGLVANVSTRLPVGTDDNVLIEGFIVLGPSGSTKTIMVRALGPFLTQFGVTDALANPTLEIRDGSNTVVATNNDWRNTQVGGIITGDQAAEIEGSGLAPANDLESAIIAELVPGSYTAVVRGAGNTTGTGVVDAYDMSASSPAKLANIATRGLIQPGDNLMIAGFIIQNGDVRAVVRAVGPSLSAFGVGNALEDTTLQLRDQNGNIVRENDDWESDPQKQQLIDVGLQPSDSREAAVVAILPPGQYTVQVRGKPETTGIGVVQVFFLQ